MTDNSLSPSYVSLAYPFPLSSADNLHRMAAKNKQEALELLRQDLDTPERYDRYKDSDLVIEILTALEGYWQDNSM